MVGHNYSYLILFQKFIPLVTPFSLENYFQKNITYTSFYFDDENEDYFHYFIAFYCSCSFVLEEFIIVAKLWSISHESLLFIKDVKAKNVLSIPQKLKQLSILARILHHRLNISNQFTQLNKKPSVGWFLSLTIIDNPLNVLLPHPDNEFLAFTFNLPLDRQMRW